MTPAEKTPSEHGTPSIDSVPDLEEAGATCTTPESLGEAMARWVIERSEAFLQRFFSGPVVPRFQAGHIMATDTCSALLGLFRSLHRLGVKEIGGVSPAHWVRRFLPTIDGAKAQTFGSLAVAETLHAWGPFDGNPLLEGLSASERDNLAAACDTTHIYLDDGTIGEWSANYWMVLARAEYLRQQLGLLADTTILDAAVAQCRRLLEEQGDDHFDDSATGVGRYDHYSMGMMGICQPLYHLLPQAPLRASLRRDVEMVEVLAMENGAAVVWGRSVGLLSVTGTIGHAVAALRDGLSDDPGRMFGLAAHAAAQVPGWFQDDLVAAHRGRMTFDYRGPQRLMEMTAGCLGSMAGMAGALREVPPPPPSKGPLFPERDGAISFDRRNAGVWMFRNEHLAFQLPFVSAWLGADYVPWLHSPGCFENPVDCPMRFGVPVVLQEGKAFGPGELPASVTKEPNALTLTYDSLLEEVSGGWMPNPDWERRAAELALTWRVEGDRVHFEQHLKLPAAPQGLVISIPQASRPLSVEMLRCSVPCSQDTIVVAGMGQYRSYWGQVVSIVELHLQPAAEVDVHFVVQLG